ncbi:MAG: transglutaminase domain-containing protein [Deltaproteobacteria bacterium]|nr:transglutaminase domain-containing protein [Deltaproteobacteria bacterium]
MKAGLAKAVVSLSIISALFLGVGLAWADDPVALFNQAETLRQAGSFTAAIEKYVACMEGYHQAGQPTSSDALESQKWVERLQTIKYELPLTYDQAKEYIDEEIEQACPQSTPEQRQALRDEFLNAQNISRLYYDGQFHYLQQSELILNLLHRDFRLNNSLDLFGASTLPEASNATFAKIDQLIETHASRTEWDATLFDPIGMEMTVKVNIPSAQIPSSGDVEVWIPLALPDAFQDQVEITYVSPEEYRECTTLTEVGNMYFKIPAAEIQGDVDIEVVFNWQRYQQRVVFSTDRVVGLWQYDPPSHTFSFASLDQGFYTNYTQDTPNIVVSSAIRAKAFEIVEAYLAASGQMTLNPYQCARAIYDYMLANQVYSHLPWATINYLQRKSEWSADGQGYIYDGLADDGQSIEEARKIGLPVSEFVFNHGYGDCGALGAQYAALCRAAGLPAVSTGGYQTIRGWGTASGHVWAAFYLPVYGWILVDPSIGMIPEYLYLYGEYAGNEELYDQRTGFLFGGMDNYRLDLQDNMDRDITPTPAITPSFTIVFQSPNYLIQERAPNEMPLCFYVTSTFEAEEMVLGASGQGP